MNKLFLVHVVLSMQTTGKQKKGVGLKVACCIGMHNDVLHNNAVLFDNAVLVEAK